MTYTCCQCRRQEIHACCLYNKDGDQAFDDGDDNIQYAFCYACCGGSNKNRWFILDVIQTGQQVRPGL